MVRRRISEAQKWQIIDITVHDRFWNVGQANCILKYFENMMIDHSDLIKRKGV
jgi:hypothetical protein